MTFLGSGVNYMHELSNGDWVLLYSFDNYADFNRVLQKVKNILFHTNTTTNNSATPNSANKTNTANAFNDGLKFVGRVASVSRDVSKDPEEGRRHVVYNATANGFTDLDMTLFYNEFLTVQYQDLDAALLHIFGVTLTQFQSNQTFVNGQEVVPLVIDSILGLGPQDSQAQNANINGKNYVATPNDILRIPTTLARLLIGASFSPQNPAGYTFADLLVSRNRYTRLVCTKCSYARTRVLL
jgi:hypothetical protein